MAEKFEIRNQLDKDLIELLKDEKFYQYYQFLISENKKYNLTRITDVNDVYYKHFYDSIYLSKLINLDNQEILDVGSGAGFPSIPLRIINPKIQITIIDSLNKRIHFLEELIGILKISNVKLIHGRAEELAKKQFYDIVVARAVAKLNILAEITLPYVKTGGFFVAMKSVNFENELSEANSAIAKLGGKVISADKYKIDENEEHVLIIIKKISPTPSMFPRQFGKIKKSPL